MLSRPITTVVTSAAVLAVVLLPGASASADDPWEPVDCTAHPQSPGCTVTVGTPQRRGGDGGGGDHSGGGSGAGHDACRWVRAGDRPPPAGADPAGGGWYMQVCGNDTSALGTAPQWIANPPAAAPAVLARRASADLTLPSPRIRANPDPGHDLLVQVPIWLWIDPSSWGARSANAAVPGLSVTATARPTQVRWEMGDGTTLTCTGPGTVWRAGGDPSAASPDCGHVYRRSSAGASGGAFTVRATVTWSVSWVGAGTEGTLAPLTTTSTVDVHVAESQAINGGTA
ncbi:hypothetical protein [Actinoplanes subtropicus]|uniref:hypothetical protein n=1 Tax=Actinoplanes subtropicus TaxID=543632 RepID=UPI0004C2E562|nr:hypothetical protein [Actinoplanes subtropicus]